jgi:hypothetical protein
MKLGHREGNMTSDEFLAYIRGATENDIEAALEDAYVELPLTTPVQALEMFNRMLDVLTGDSDQADAMDRARIVSVVHRRGSD